VWSPSNWPDTCTVDDAVLPADALTEAVEIAPEEASLHPPVSPTLEELLEELARTLTRGAKRYGADNWRFGSRAFFEDCWNHAYAHLLKAKQGLTTRKRKEHLGHTVANCAFLLFALEKGEW